MTQPRMRIPGATLHVTRTILERRFLLLPVGPVSEVFLFCFFHAAKVHGILVHALFVHSNHYHCVLSDPRGALSDFTQYAHWLISQCLLDYHRGLRPEANLEVLWSTDDTNEDLLTTHNAVLKEIVYDITNPVRDGMVYTHGDWPGICMGPREWLLPPRVVSRPKYFFSDKSKLPETVECKLVPPPQFGDRSPELLAREVQALIDCKERALRATRRAHGQTFMGVKRILRADPFDSPDSPRPRGGTTPTVAAGGDREAFAEAKKRVRDFRGRYRSARTKYRHLVEAGSAAAKEVIFPFGTLLMRKLHGLPCDDPDLSWCVLAHAPS